jgi:hypothetical protein
MAMQRQQTVCQRVSTEHQRIVPPDDESVGFLLTGQGDLLHAQRRVGGTKARSLPMNVEPRIDERNARAPRSRGGRGARMIRSSKL